MTNLPNRYSYNERLTQEYNRWRRYRHSLTMVIGDIDLFKKVNDEHGHSFGDKVLRIIATFLSDGIRESDFVARFGGEEFTVFNINGVGCFGVSICYDMWFPETTRTLVSMGAEVILHPSLTNTLDRDAELAIARSSAVTNQCYFFDINSAGKLAFGRSIIAGPGGEIIHQAGAGREIIPIEIDLEYVRRVRTQGWHNLAQPLKSFRDHKTPFPIYQNHNNSSALTELGPLAMAKKANTNKDNKSQ